MVTRVRIPKTGSIVRTPAGDNRAIRTKRYAENPRLNKISARFRMPCECVAMAPCVRIPETDGAVRTPAGDGIAIWTKRHAINLSRMPSD